MIKITVFSQNNKVIGFESKGHAGYAESGSDIYCAAVSVLTVNCANSLEALCDAELTEEQKDGYLKIMLAGKPNDSTELLFQSMIMGLQGINDSNRKKYLKVEFEEV